MCHFIDCEANLSNALPSVDAFHSSYEVIRGDRQCLKEQLFVSVLCLSYLLNLNLSYILFSFFKTTISKGKSCFHNFNQILYLISFYF